MGHRYSRWALDFARSQQKTSSHRAGLGAAAAGFFVACLPLGIARADTPTYTVVDLGTLGGSYSYAYALNNAGQVVGYSYTAGSSNGHATLFSGTGTGNTDLGLLPGGVSSIAYGINNSGQIVGVSTPSAGNTARHATLFSGTGSSNSDLGTLGGTFSEAHGISDSGQIAGVAASNSYTTYYGTSFGAGNAGLGTLGGLVSTANAINNSGKIVGTSYDTGGGTPRATLFGSPNTDLGTLGGSSSVANDINNAGQIVGYGDVTGNLTHHATLFGTSNVDLGTLGGTSSTAVSVNNAGQIIGNSQTSHNTYTHACIYTVGGSPADLNDLITAGPAVTNVQLTTGWGHMINDWGQIAAVGKVGTSSHAILLNPNTPLTSVSDSAEHVKLLAGTNFNKVAPYVNTSGNQTQVSILDGIATKNRDVMVSFAASTDGIVSDIANISTTAADGSTTLDKFVLQLSYTGSGSCLGWLDPASGTWKNAVLGNSDAGAGTLFVDGAYDSSGDFKLGYYGLDTVNHVAWAVVDHNSQFGVIAVPEPAICATLGSVSLAMLARRRRSAKR